MKPLDLQKTPREFRIFATALLGQPDPEAALIRLLGTVGPLVPPASAAAFALQLRGTLAESELLRRTTSYFLDTPEGSRRRARASGY